MTQATLNKLQATLGVFLTPLYALPASQAIHFIDVWMKSSKKKMNYNYLVFNLTEPVLDFDTKEMPLAAIKLWHLEVNTKGMVTMRSSAWSCDVDWFFFFTLEGTVFLCNVHADKYSLQVESKYFIPLLSMFLAGELEGYFCKMISDVSKQPCVQLGMF
jgi:hypothetical protein